MSCSFSLLQASVVFFLKIFQEFYLKFSQVLELGPTVFRELVLVEVGSFVYNHSYGEEAPDQVELMI